MPDITVIAILCTTRPIAKYGGVSLSAGVLNDIVRAVSRGDVPMRFGHSARIPVPGHNMRCRRVQLEDGEYAVEATFDVDADAWEYVQRRFAAAGVPAGLSFSITEPQLRAAAGKTPVFALAADAAAWSDMDRHRAWELLDARAPTDVGRLYEFSAEELAHVAIDFWPQVAAGIGINLMSSVLYDAVKRLVERRPSKSEIELKRHDADGAQMTAVVTTSDPDVLRTALEALPPRNEHPVMYYDADKRLWLPNEAR